MDPCLLLQYMASQAAHRNQVWGYGTALACFERQSICCASSCSHTTTRSHPCMQIKKAKAKLASTRLQLSKQEDQANEVSIQSDWVAVECVKLSPYVVCRSFSIPSTCWCAFCGVVCTKLALSIQPISSARCHHDPSADAHPSMHRWRKDCGRK